MAITLASASELGLDDKQQALAEEIITTDNFFRLLPFVTTSGNAYSYERELALPTAEGVAIGGSFTATNATYQNVTVGLTTVGAQIEINKLLQAQGVGNVVDGGLVASQMKRGAKSVARKFAEWLIVGDKSNAVQFDGIQTLMADSAFTSQVIDYSSTDAALTEAMLDDLVSAVKLRRPDVIMTTSKGVNKIKALMRAHGGVTYGEVAGVQMLMWDGIPLIANDWLSSDVDGVTSGTQADVYAICLGDDGLHGVTTTDGAGIGVEYVGVHQTKDQDIFRVKMYGAIAIASTKSIAVLKSVTVA